MSPGPLSWSGVPANAVVTKQCAAAPISGEGGGTLASPVPPYGKKPYGKKRG